MRCTKCGVVTCDKCGTVNPRFTVHPPFGSLSAMEPVSVCGYCYTEYVRLGFEWLGRPIPEGMWPAKGFEYK